MDDRSIAFDHVIAVAGAGRCGSSLMMRMLDEAGVPVLADSRVSYEWDGVKYSTDALPEARGKAVKCLTPILGRGEMHPGLRVDWIWLTRNAKEQSRSNVKFMSACGWNVPPGSRRLIEQSLRREEPRVLKQLHASPLHRVRTLRFEYLIEHPRAAASAVAEFLMLDLDVERMASVVLPRGTDCYPGLLELERLEEVEANG